MTRMSATAAALLLLAALATHGAAAPKNKVHVKEDGKGTKVKIQYKGGGPPPWAPAHGYRRGSTPSSPASPSTAVYVAPFHIDVGRCNRGELGAVLGGVAGGVLGSKVGDGSGRTAAIIGGTILGAIVGESIGRWMDQVDQACVGQALEHAPTGRPVEWVNPDTGVVYGVTPTETYRASDDRYCREYQTTANVGGRQEKVYGTACRQPDGSWELVSSR